MSEEKTEIIGIEDVMKLYSIGRHTATRYLSMKSCPTMPRRKGQKYQVERHAFEEWLRNGGK